jgi:hypothetical protein
MRLTLHKGINREKERRQTLSARQTSTQTHVCVCACVCVYGVTKRSKGYTVTRGDAVLHAHRHSDNERENIEKQVSFRVMATAIW